MTRPATSAPTDSVVTKTTPAGAAGSGNAGWATRPLVSGVRASGQAVRALKTRLHAPRVTGDAPPLLVRVTLGWAIALTGIVLLESLPFLQRNGVWLDLVYLDTRTTILHAIAAAFLLYGLYVALITAKRLRTYLQVLAVVLTVTTIYSLLRADYSTMFGPYLLRFHFVQAVMAAGLLITGFFLSYRSAGKAST